MPKKLKGFSVNEHKKNAAKIYNSYKYYGDLIIELQKAYGKTSESVKYAKNVYKAINSLRCELDDRVCGENPDLPDHEVIGIYYQGPK